jgi:hypothetical protein
MIPNIGSKEICMRITANIRHDYVMVNADPRFTNQLNPATIVATVAIRSEITDQWWRTTRRAFANGFEMIIVHD